MSSAEIIDEYAHELNLRDYRSRAPTDDERSNAPTPASDRFTPALDQFTPEILNAVEAARQLSASIDHEPNAVHELLVRALGELSQGQK